MLTLLPGSEYGYDNREEYYFGFPLRYNRNYCKRSGQSASVTYIIQLAGRKCIKAERFDNPQQDEGNRQKNVDQIVWMDKMTDFSSGQESHGRDVLCEVSQRNPKDGNVYGQDWTCNNQR